MLDFFLDKIIGPILTFFGIGENIEEGYNREERKSAPEKKSFMSSREGIDLIASNLVKNSEPKVEHTGETGFELGETHNSYDRREISRSEAREMVKRGAKLYYVADFPPEESIKCGAVYAVQNAREGLFPTDRYFTYELSKRFFDDWRERVRLYGEKFYGNWEVGEINVHSGVAFGDFAHAEGADIIASGSDSHTEGWDTRMIM